MAYIIVACISYASLLTINTSSACYTVPENIATGGTAENWI